MGSRKSVESLDDRFLPFPTARRPDGRRWRDSFAWGSNAGLPAVPTNHQDDRSHRAAALPARFVDRSQRFEVTRLVRGTRVPPLAQFHATTFTVLGVEPNEPRLRATLTSCADFAGGNRVSAETFKTDASHGPLENPVALTQRYAAAKG